MESVGGRNRAEVPASEQRAVQGGCPYLQDCAMVETEVWVTRLGTKWLINGRAVWCWAGL